VQRVLELARLNAATDVSVDARVKPLAGWLETEREITRLTRPFIEAHARRAGDPRLDAALAPDGAPQLRQILRDWQVADLLREHPAEWSAADLVTALRPLTPRLYSIASSRRAVGDEVHLTVAVVDYQRDSERRFGAASRFLATRSAEGGTVRAFVEPNPRFRLPKDTARDVIMIGPGTGVAPFRGFVQERAESGAQGRNWLFFGARHLDSEFLYQAEWLAALKRGTLQRLDVAFSRDQAQRLYVQQRMREHGAELYRWLEGGAHVYVCGDAQQMAQDVHAALVDVVRMHGGRDPDGAAAYVDALLAQRRYARDVY
jgi:sulfite reductase (NADPH) flavoprotein alpha-component